MHLLDWIAKRQAPPASIWLGVGVCQLIEVPIYSFYITHIASFGAESTPNRSKVKRHLANSFKKIISLIC
jgi:hypothetical protein